MKTIFDIFKSDIRAITKYIFVLIIVLALGALASRDTGIDLQNGQHVNSIVFTLIVYSLVFALENIGLAAVAFGLLLHKPMKGIIEIVEESKRESDVML